MTGVCLRIIFWAVALASVVPTRVNDVNHSVNSIASSDTHELFLADSHSSMTLSTFGSETRTFIEFFASAHGEVYQLDGTDSLFEHQRPVNKYLDLVKHVAGEPFELLCQSPESSKRAKRELDHGRSLMNGNCFETSQEETGGLWR